MKHATRSLFFSIIVLFLLVNACKNNSADNKINSEKLTEKTADKKSVINKKTILFFGNSLTAAYGLAPEQGFPNLIQKKLDSLGLNFKVTDAGVSGNTTADGKGRIDWVLQQQIDIFVLELGGNDALRGLPVDVAKANLQAILTAVKTKYPEAKLVIAGMQAPPNLGKKYATDFAKMYPELARENNCALIPFLLENVGGEVDLNQKDGIHPTASGQKIVAANVWAVLKNLVLENQ